MTLFIRESQGLCAEALVVEPEQLLLRALRLNEVAL